MMDHLSLQSIDYVNLVRNSRLALNRAGIVLKCDPAAKQRGIISNGVKGGQS
jgi:hypothetical protein